MSVENICLEFCAETLETMCGRIETCVAKLTPDQIWSRGGENQNAVGNLMLHLSGNVRQWILHGVGGQPDHRQRDTEFAARQLGVDELKQRLRSTVDEAASVIRAAPPATLTGRRSIQKYDVTVLEAILHVTEHFSGHTAQIILLTKALTGQDLGFYWHLSPPAKSASKP